MVPCHWQICPGHGFAAFMGACADVRVECTTGEPEGPECTSSEVQACGLGPLFGWLCFHFVIMPLRLPQSSQATNERCL